LEEFIETGTFQGATAAWAAANFARVTSIELSPAYHAAAQKKFVGQPTIRLVCGDSAAALAQIIKQLRQPSLFWLDAHWSGADTAGEKAECPVLGELELINESSLQHVVLVDDARLFCAPPPSPHKADHWPSLSELISALSAGGRRHVVIYEDVFIAVPVEQRRFLDQWLQFQASASHRPRFDWLAKMRK
jgi:hypothetical protein